MSAGACTAFAAVFEYRTRDVFAAEQTPRDSPADNAASRSGDLSSNHAERGASERELARLRRQVHYYAEALEQLERTEAQLADGAYPEVNREQVDEHRRQLTQAHARAVERLRAFEQTPATGTEAITSGRDPALDDH